jgi:hypothetical protein
VRLTQFSEGAAAAEELPHEEAAAEEDNVGGDVVGVW